MSSKHRVPAVVNLEGSSLRSVRNVKHGCRSRAKSAEAEGDNFKAWRDKTRSGDGAESVDTPPMRISDKNKKSVRNQFDDGIRYFYSTLELGAEAVLRNTKPPNPFRASYSEEDSAGTQDTWSNNSLLHGGEEEGESQYSEAESNVEDGVGCLAPSLFSCSVGCHAHEGPEDLLRAIDALEDELKRIDAIKARHAADPDMQRLAGAKQRRLWRRQRALLERFAREEDDVAHRKYNVERRRVQLRRTRQQLEADRAEEEAAARAEEEAEDRRRRANDISWGELSTLGGSAEGDDTSVAEEGARGEEGLQSALRLFVQYTAEKYQIIRKNRGSGLWQVVVE